jgi:hypothetical protein
MRAADSDRQFVADRLREALDQGRLSLGEYDERLQQAYAAKTYGELDGLLHDLPTVVPAGKAQLATTTPAPPTAPEMVGQPQPRGGLPNWMLAMWGGWLTTSLILGVIWLATAPGGYPWPIWAVGPWGAVLLARTIMAYASGNPHGYDRAERDRDRQRKQERRDRRREQRHR